jgi:hypothetical protein
MGMADLKEKSFLSLCTYYRLFILGFVNIVNSTDQTHGREITPEVEVAFESLKETHCTAPILAYRRPGEKFTVDTDASRVRIGGVLSQVQGGQEQVIAYCSKTLNKAERNYCATGWELLAIVRTLEQCFSTTGPWHQLYQAFIL